MQFSLVLRNPKIIPANKWMRDEHWIKLKAPIKCCSSENLSCIWLTITLWCYLLCQTLRVCCSNRRLSKVIIAEFNMNIELTTLRWAVCVWSCLWKRVDIHEYTWTNRKTNFLKCAAIVIVVCNRCCPSSMMQNCFVCYSKPWILVSIFWFAQ